MPFLGNLLRSARKTSHSTKKLTYRLQRSAPEERARRRWAFRNERTLYEGTCDLCQESIITIYSKDKPYTVYCQDCWWSYKWDPADFGQEFDFDRPFFEQFAELLQKVPRSTLYNINPENSDYCQQAYGNKNCYFCSVLKDSENCKYISHATNVKDTIDCTHINKSELCYWCVDSHNLYHCLYSQNCNDSNDVYFSYDCNGCSDCFGCVGLRNAKYHIANKPYSKEEYFKKLESLELGRWSTIQQLKQQSRDFRLKFPHRATRNINVENSVGDRLKNTKNAYQCFDAFDIEDCAYSIWIFRTKDAYDCYGMGDSELIYEGLGVEEVTRCFFNTFTTGSTEVHYSDSCFSSQNLFGCVGMKKGQHFILNKKYSKEEYDEMKAKIIHHMELTGEYGEFFPISLSPFGYNETVAHEYFPLTQEKAEERGYAWKEKDLQHYQKQRYELADNIHDEKDGVCKALLACLDCGRNYRILESELKFYRKNSIPAPRHCVFCRHKMRMAQRPLYKLFTRKCEKCNQSVQTPYAPDQPGKVVCEACYLAEIY